VMHYSATPHDWITNDNEEPERRLFPGFVALFWSATAMLLFRRHKSGGTAAALQISLSFILLGFLGSLGLHTFFHRFLFAHVPGFSGMRVPARWAMVAYIGIAILVALATSARKWVAIVASAALLLELRQAPIRWYLAVPETPPVYAALGGAHAIVELPLDAYREYATMLRATAHHLPFANGVSGIEPPEHKRLVALANSDAFIDELQRIGVDRVIVHEDFVNDATKAWMKRELDRGRVVSMGRFDNGANGDTLLSLNATQVGLKPDLRSAAALFFPHQGETLHGGAFFSGFARSADGIRSIDLLFNNGAMRFPATRKPGTDLFFAGFDRRPPNIRAHADVQVEITDGRGVVKRLDDVWFEWP
jgi:hypothetical protein